MIFLKSGFSHPSPSELVFTIVGPLEGTMFKKTKGVVKGHVYQRKERKKKKNITNINKKS